MAKGTMIEAAKPGKPKNKPSLSLSAEKIADIDQLNLKDDVELVVVGKVKSLSAPTEWSKEYRLELAIESVKVRNVENEDRTFAKDNDLPITDAARVRSKRAAALKNLEK